MFTPFLVIPAYILIVVGVVKALLAVLPRLPTIQPNSRKKSLHSANVAAYLLHQTIIGRLRAVFYILTMKQIFRLTSGDKNAHPR